MTIALSHPVVRRRALVLGLALLAFACGEPVPGDDDGGPDPVDAGASGDGSPGDAGSREDAGSGGDDASIADAGTEDAGTAAMDAGASFDAGVTTDAGADAGSASDAGLGDAGSPGMDAGMDAGVASDAGSTPMDAGRDAGPSSRDGGPGDAGSTSMDAAVSTGLPLSIGYYVEDAVDNPEDPTVGTILIRIPSANGPFTGQIPFGYVGCTMGADVASLSGTRTGSMLSGTWAGTVDGIAIGGGFDVTHSAAASRWDGTFTTSGGKVLVSFPPCQYYVAGHGTVRIFDAPTNQPASFVATATAGTSPSFSWPSRGSGVGYVVRVFDVDCVVATPSSSACYMGEALLLATSIAYPSGFSGSRGPLTVGRTYVATVTAQRLTGGLEGFSPIVLRP